MKRSESLFNQAKKLLVGGVNSPVRAFRAVGGTPVFIRRGRGATLVDVDGKSYIDYLSSWGPLLLGHAVPAVLRASTQSLRKGSTFGAPTEEEVRLADLVRRAIPSMELMRFVSSGTEACMSALRLARGFTGRKLIVKFAGCYHGHSDGLLVAAGSGATTFGHPTSGGVPPETARLTLVLPYNDPEQVSKIFRRHGRDIAAVIIEPVCGNMGVVPGNARFLSVLREVTKKYGALLIFDEVITGFRLHWSGAQRLLGVVPDLTCLGKILGGGFPVGAFGGARRIMGQLAPLGPVYQAGTLSGNPVAMAAGVALLNEIRRRQPYESLRKRTAALVDGLKASAQRHGVPVTINSRGSMFTVFFTSHPVTDYASALRSDTKLYARFFHGLLKRGVYFPPAQFEAAFVSAAHTDRHIAKTIRAADLAFQEVA